MINSKVFVHTKEYRSDSEGGEYVAGIVNTLKNQQNFDNFKQDASYQMVLEHVSEQEGEDYLKIVSARDDGLLEKALSTVLQSDAIGNPTKYRYEGYDIPLSPTTIRYLKVASDLKALFGENLGNVVEIGCGYGGQAYVNDQLLEVELATLFDLPVVNKLIERYLDALLLDGAYKTQVINQAQPKDFDLVISNYAFSELPAILQDAYIKKILSRSARGYLTMNSGLSGARSAGKLSLAALSEKLPPFEVYKEEPLTAPYNYLIVWGHNTELAAANFSTKKVHL